VSDDLPSPRVDQGVIRSCLAEIGAAHEECVRFFLEVFDQFESMAGQLAARQQAWLVRRKEEEEDFRRRQTALEQQRAELAARQEQILKESSQVRAESAAAAAEESTRFAQAMAEAQQERSALRDAVQTALGDVARLGQVAQDLTATREELTLVREEMHKQQSAWEAACQTAAPAPPPPPADGAPEKIESLGKELAAMERERAVLETELEAVRNRAAEMAEALESQRRQSAEERALWTEELKRLRGLMEALAERQAEEERPPATVPMVRAGACPANPPQEAAAPAPAAGPTADPDPLLNSVMAQFQMLQKDLARRRKSAVDSA